MTDDEELILASLAAAHTSQGQFYRVPCPFCGGRTGKDDRKASLAVSKTTGIYTCWKCGEKGRVRLDEADQVTAEIPQPEYTERFAPPKGWVALAGPDLCAEPGRRYVGARLGSDEKRDRQACLGYCPAGDGYFAMRVIVPVLDLDGTTWLGYAGRDTTGRSPVKYRYPKGMERHLYNRAALYAPQPYALVVEGTFDALAHWPRGVACLGKPSDKQVEALAGARVPLAICLDGDAQKDAWALTSRLAMRGVPAFHVPMAHGEDPATVTRQDMVLRVATVMGGW